MLPMGGSFLPAHFKWYFYIYASLRWESIISNWFLTVIHGKSD